MLPFDFFVFNVSASMQPRRALRPCRAQRHNMLCDAYLHRRKEGNGSVSGARRDEVFRI